jgi:hypothetical protein
VVEEVVGGAALDLDGGLGVDELDERVGGVALALSVVAVGPVHEVAQHEDHLHDAAELVAGAEFVHGDVALLDVDPELVVARGEFALVHEARQSLGQPRDDHHLQEELLRHAQLVLVALVLLDHLDLVLGGRQPHQRAGHVETEHLLQRPAQGEREREREEGG